MRRTIRQRDMAADIVKNSGVPYAELQASVIRQAMTQQDVFIKYVARAGEDRDEAVYFAALEAAKYSDGTLTLRELLPETDNPEIDKLDADKGPDPKTKQDYDPNELFVNDDGIVTLSKKAYDTLLRRLERVERLLGLRSPKNKLTRKSLSEYKGKDIISQAEAMRLIGCGKTTIKRWADEGMIQAYTQGTHVYYSQRELLQSDVVIEYRCKSKGYGRND